MAERHYRGAFCTGHVPMVGTTSIQFSENAMHEFIEEYKQAHGMQERKGPGTAKLYDMRDQPKRPAPPLPIAGCALASLNTGVYPERQHQTSSKAVGGWWTDPIFQKRYDAPTEAPKVPASMGISTSSQVGQYFHDPELSAHDPVMAKLRAQNGCKRVLPVEENSQFALEALPIQHRLL
jgi:hypothetical protein